MTIPLLRPAQLLHLGGCNKPTTEGNGMVTTEEIRERVEQADRQRLESRAAAATATAAAIEQRILAQQGLASATQAAAAQIAAATVVMTIDELAEFTGFPVAELGPREHKQARRNGHDQKPVRPRTPRAPRAQSAPEPAPPARVVEAVEQWDAPAPAGEQQQ